MTPLPAPTLDVLTGPTLPELLRDAAAARADATYAAAEGTTLSFAGLADAVGDACRGLAALGVRAGDRVAVMLPNHLDHVALVHALVAMRAVWVPVNTRLRGEPLAHVLADSDPALLLADERHRAELESLRRSDLPRTVWHETGSQVPWRPHASGAGGGESPAGPGGDDVVSIMYTSGTTGPAKGVQVTDRMLRAAALGAAAVSLPRDGDVYFLWEPLCHVGGAQVLFLPFVAPVGIAMVERFSASAFWTQVTEAGATHVHHLGGIVPMLLSRPSSDAERAHRVRVSWGGGMTVDAWTAAEHRFGLRVHECYGMTEASSISTANTAGVGDGIGAELPWFDVELHDDAGRPVPDGTVGEIALRPRVDGLLTPGYFRNDEATAASRRGPWWRTGDAARRVDGALHFVGRRSDSVRHRGENVSAWEVERVVNTHDAVAESAVVGVPAAEGDEDVKLFVTLARPDEPFDAAALVTWCRERLAGFQVPRYVAVVDEFARTPSLRIKKASLPRTTGDAYDARA